jgi:hypothetical protein
MSYLYLPFIIQGLVMGVDEKIHVERGLGKWERFGHPLDTLTVLIPVSYAALQLFSNNGLILFVVLSLFSCFFITKDEFIHTKECSGLENWLHAVLFILHPMIFLATGLLWRYRPEDLFLKVQPILVFIFMMYQILRWSVPWHKFTK